MDEMTPSPAPANRERPQRGRWAGLSMAWHVVLRGVVVIAAFAGIYGVFYWIDEMPDGATAWGEANLEEPIRQFTTQHLRDLSDNTAACFAALDGSDMQFTPVEARSRTPECRWDAGVQIDQSNIDYADPEPAVASCALAAALYIWEREVVMPAAREHLGSDVAEVLHYGTYNCRRENFSQAGRWSQHAAANAIDISGFLLEDGRTIGVRFWNRDDERAAFLREVRDGSCQLFTGVMGPEYNDAHADHFHLDMGPWEICS